MQQGGSASGGTYNKDGVTDFSLPVTDIKNFIQQPKQEGEGNNHCHQQKKNNGESEASKRKMSQVIIKYPSKDTEVENDNGAEHDNQ